MRRLYRALWEHAIGHRTTLVVALALLVGSQLFKLVIPALAGRAINTMQAQGLAGATEAAGMLGLVFLATLVSWALHGPGRILERNVALQVRGRHSAALMDRLFNAPLAWHQRHHGAETGHRVQQSNRALYDFGQSQFIYLQSATRLIGPVIALALISVWVGAVAVAGYLVLAVIIVGFDRVMMRLATRENDLDRRYWSSLTDAMGNMLSVLALRMKVGVERLVASRLAAVAEPLRRAIVYNEAKWATVDILNQALWIGLVMLYVMLAATGGGSVTPIAVPAAPGAAPTGGIALGNLFMVYEYALQAGGVITGIAAHFQALARQKTDFSSADPIMALDASAPAGPDPTPLSQTREAAESGWRQLVLEGVRYRHGDVAAIPAIEVDRLVLERGRRYALVGASGSGKTTLLRVLAGLHAPDAGTLIVRGGTDSGAPHTDVRRRLASIATLIPQEPELFGATVAENLALALPAGTAGDGGDRESIDKALDLAQATGFIDAMPAARDSELSARGGNLSGGQRQRLALARGLVAAADSSLLLLDEPTAALDPETERLLVERVLAARQDATVIAAIHRPALLDLFDAVLVVVDGRLVDAGSAGGDGSESASAICSASSGGRPSAMRARLHWSEPNGTSRHTPG